MSSYYPSIKDFKDKFKVKSSALAEELTSKLPTNIKSIDGLITPNHIVNDGLDQTLDQRLLDLNKQLQASDDPKKRQYFDALMQRLASISGLTPMTYEAYNHNRNTMSFWFPTLKKAAQKQSFFKIPKTKIITLPPELSSYMRIEYQNTTPDSRKFFNQWLFKHFNEHFDLDVDKEYFIKTGTFSSKFEFHNAHLTEPEEIGDYFSVINNFAMQVGAGLTNDVVVREWIPDPEKHDTIYDGMPLRTEFRAFIDCDHNQLIDIVPYWNPIVMKNVLSQQGQYCQDIQADYQTYLRNQDRLVNEFNQYQNTLRKELLPIIDKLDLEGCWSLDIMKSGNDFYLIDMADMRNSALTELISKDKLEKYQHYLTV